MREGVNSVFYRCIAILSLYQRILTSGVSVFCLYMNICSAVQVGQRVLFFGGGAGSTNTVSALSVPPPPTLDNTSRKTGNGALVTVEQKVQLMVDELHRADVVRSEEDTDAVIPASPRGVQEGFSLHLPDVASVLNAVTSRPIFPRPRLSAAAALVGRHWVVVGGFSVEHDQMGDVWVR